MKVLKQFGRGLLNLLFLSLTCIGLFLLAFGPVILAETVSPFFILLYTIHLIVIIYLFGEET